MTVTVFDCDHQPNGSQPVHEKPTFTEIARRVGHIKVRILRIRSELRDIDTLLNDLHEIIIDLEEVTRHD